MSDDEIPQGVIDRDTVRELFEEGVPVTFITRDVVKVAGQVCHVIDTGSAEDSEGVICAPYHPEMRYPNSVEDVCIACGRVVVVRNHAPKKPPRFCVPCAVKKGLVKL